MKITPKEGTGCFLVNVSCSNEHYNICDYAYITLKDKDIRQIEFWMRQVKELSEKDSDLYSVDLWSYIDWLPTGDSEDALDFEVTERIDELLYNSDDFFVEIEPLEGIDETARIDCIRLTIKSDSFIWKGYLKGCSDRYTSPLFWGNDLKKLGITPPGKEKS